MFIADFHCIILHIVISSIIEINGRFDLMELTVAEIGRRAGCSGGTVSRVINNSGYVSSETRQAVLKAMQESGYIPRSPRSMGRPGSRPAERMERGTIEVICLRSRPWESFSMDHGQVNVGPLPDQNERTLFPDILDHCCGFHRAILFGIVEECRRLGYKVLLKAAGDLSDRQFISEVNAPDKSGVLLFGEDSPDLGEFVRQCRHPLVLVDMITKNSTDTVTVDNFAGIQMAFQHLYQLGHRKIGFVTGDEGLLGFTERINAYKLNMMETGLPIREEWIYQCPNPFGFGKIVEMMRGRLNKDDLPTAIMCCNDLAALAVMRAADQLGIEVPNNLNVIGFDDIDVASLVTPPLTTVRFPITQAGREAVSRLLVRIQREKSGNSGKKGNQAGCKILLKPELMVRNSTVRCTNV